MSCAPLFIEDVISIKYAVVVYGTNAWYTSAAGVSSST